MTAAGLCGLPRSRQPRHTHVQCPAWLVTWREPAPVQMLRRADGCPCRCVGLQLGLALALLAAPPLAHARAAPKLARRSPSTQHQQPANASHCVAAAAAAAPATAAGRWPGADGGRAAGGRGTAAPLHTAATSDGATHVHTRVRSVPNTSQPSRYASTGLVVPFRQHHQPVL